MINSFIEKLNNAIQTKFGSENQNKNSDNSASISSSAVDSSIFLGADFEAFKNKISQGIDAQGEESIFGFIEAAGAQDIFDSFDKNSNGIIEDFELDETAGIDGNEDDISKEDLSYIFNSLPYEKILNNFKSQIEAIETLNSYGNDICPTQGYSPSAQIAPQDSVIAPQGGTSTQTVTQSTQDRLNEIENKEIPELEEKRQEVIDTAQSEIDAKNEELDKVIEDNKEKLGQLGEDYSDKQNEIQECDKNISEYSTQISEAESQKHTCESEKAGLESELASLDTNTDDEEVNAANQERKNEIEARISELEKEIEELDKTIEETKAAKAEEEELKAQKEEELAQIQEEIEKQNPEIAKQMQEIKEAITQIETQRDEDVAEIDEQIRAKREEAIECQKEIGEKKGLAQSGPFAGYDAQKGEALAQNALSVRGTTGWCLAGVNDSLQETGYFGKRLSFSGAYEAIEALQGKVAGYEDIASQFQEVSVSREELKTLPAGAIVVWDQSPGNEWGHISIALGDGRESSDHITTQMTDRDAEYHVFIPV